MEIRHLARLFTIHAVLCVMLLAASPAMAQVTAFRQAVAEAASNDEDLAAFYRAREFEGVWSGADQAAQDRRNALLAALSDAPAHGLAANRYDVNRLISALQAARTPAAQGRMDVELSRIFLQYARDVQTGMLVPGDVDNAIKREVPYRDRMALLTAFLDATPASFLRDLPPSAPEYTRLMREKLRMESLIAQGGWGPAVPVSSLAPGDASDGVVALRNRLMAMGYLDRTVTRSYDAVMEAAVLTFQEAHGLEATGRADQATMAAINLPIEQRLQSVLVAMERERWMNMERGERHIWVNLTDFSTRIIDADQVTFETRSVIGATARDRQTPEFSDSMSFMVINPSWYVPRSIIARTYLPQLQRNPNAASYMEITDSQGRRINRNAVNFNQYSGRSFPFAMRQPPSPNNSLGLVKFMFPNQYNIYLHDTPEKNLFGQPVRAYSSGCVRLNDPFDFAYALLSAQTDDPEDFFQERLRTGAETRVNLDEPVPVHLVYRTAFTSVTGALNFRADVYGRDARIWEALAREGVVIAGVQG